MLHFESFITSHLQLLKLPLYTYSYLQIYPNNPGTNKLLVIMPSSHCACLTADTFFIMDEMSLLYLNILHSINWSYFCFSFFTSEQSTALPLRDMQDLQSFLGFEMCVYMYIFFFLFKRKGIQESPYTILTFCK